MKTKSYKSDCTLVFGEKQFEGVAQVIEVPYGERTVFCNFVMQGVFEDMFRMGDFGNTSAGGTLRLEDGREVSVFPFQWDVSSGYLEIIGAGVFPSLDLHQDDVSAEQAEG